MPYGWINMLPKESMTLKANIKGYDSKKVTYMWDSRKYGIAEGGSTCTVKAPSSLGEGTVDISPCFDGESVEYSYEQAVNVRNCKLAVSINDMKTFKKATEPLKVGETYWLNLGGADWGWNYKNGSHTFYKIKLSQNGKTLNIDDNEKGLKSDFANIGIGAGGGVPNRILTPKKAGTLTITGTIYRNGKAFKTVTKKVKITNKVSVKMTTLSSVKNVKGKKMLVKWKKNTSGNGYQIQYSTSSKFAKGNKTKTISKNSTTSCTISKLSKNKTYYVRICTCKKVAKKTYYSGWSTVKKVKITK